MVRVVCHEALGCDQHCRQAAFHICSATSAEHAVLVDQGIERIILPVLHRSGRHHIGVTGETQYRPFAGAVSGPEIIDVFDAHRLKLEAGIAQALHHHRLAIGIDRRDRWSADQV
ncbi:hypothetical protein APX70_06094, partial [Pseudomonas syringae pv. maculicola]